METGIVYKSTGSWYRVKTSNGKFYDCNIRGKIRTHDIKSTNPLAVGDVVDFERSDKDNTGMIITIKDRKNYLIRKSSNLSKQSHIIAANIDQAVLIVTLTMPKTTSLFIDRFLISTEAYRIPTVLLINKIDLYNDQLKKTHDEIVNIYTHAGYACYETSITKNINIEKIKDIFKNNVSVIAGNSGVGKSSLINAINPGLKIKIDDISAYHKSGKHTTTFAEMFDLDFGGQIIDTPGIKGYGLINFNREEIYHFFPEIFNISHQCKFHNCLHVQEPGCAVRYAVKHGLISSERYNNYLSILLDDETKYRM